MKTYKSTNLITELERFISASKSGRRRKTDGNKFSPGTIKNYRNCLRLIREFSLLTETDFLISHAVKTDKKYYVYRKSYWRRFYFPFREFLYRKGHYDNYVNHVVKVIRTLMKWLYRENGWLDYQFLPHSGTSNSMIHDFAIITPEMFRYLAQDQYFKCSLSKSEKLIVDLMIFGCATALRAGDLLSLKKHHFISCENKMRLVINNKKTKQKVSVLLPEFAINALKSYNEKSQRVFPRISNVNFNKGIKKIAEKAGWTHPVIISREKKGVPSILKNKKRPNQQLRYCDVLTTHSLRRSSITILLMMGMPEQLVRQISGHKPGSKEFYRYVSISQNWQDEESDKAFSRLTGQK